MTGQLVGAEQSKRAVGYYGRLAVTGLALALALALVVVVVVVSLVTGCDRPVREPARRAWDVLARHHACN